MPTSQAEGLYGGPLLAREEMRGGGKEVRRIEEKDCARDRYKTEYKICMYALAEEYLRAGKGCI